MIPQVQEILGTKVHFDNTLLTLPVYSFDSNSTEDVALWLQGIASANELFLDLSGEVIVLKNKDFARESILIQGKLSSQFLMTASSLQWQIFPVGGYNIVEYPIAHQNIINLINQVPRDPFSFNINITLIDEENEKLSGIVLESLISFATQNFDVLRFKKPFTSTKLPNFGLQHDQIDYLQDNTVNLSLTCVGGEEVIQRIDKQTSVLTTSRDSLGQMVNQSVTNFVSGFIFKLQAYPSAENCIVHIDLEMSSDIRKKESQLPEIARKQVINTGFLAVDDVWTCAEFQSNDSITNDSSSYFLPWNNRKTKSQTLLVTLKRTQ